ncbi:ribonuclease toxin immunity protein CdiI [Gilliamella apicola]
MVSESTCYHYVRLACEKYIELQAEDTNQIAELLAKMPL